MVNESAIDSRAPSVDPSIKIPLVITTAFSPHSNVPYLTLKCGDVRTRVTLYSIAWWLFRSKFDKIVVVEATGNRRFAEPLETLALLSGKVLEYIAVDNDEEGVFRQGKGFGEGYALNAAFAKSRILAEADGFFKCTGKVIVENYLECVDESKHKSFYFDVPRGINNFVDTRFYFVSKAFWVANLLDSYIDVNDSQGVFLENVYFRRIAAVSHVPFNPVVVRYSGISGSTGDSYDISSIPYPIRKLWRKSLGFLEAVREETRRLTSGRDATR